MKNKIKDTSKTELVFTDKGPCVDCKPKEVEFKQPLYDLEQLEYAITLIDQPRQTVEQMQWLISLNNRALNDKKQYGCGKCHVQVMKNIRNLYKRHMDNL
jgi:hypothetical protein